MASSSFVGLDVLSALVDIFQGAFAMADKPNATNWALGLVGAVIGGVVGHFAFVWLTNQGLYAMVLPGALVGIGCGALSGVRSNALGVMSGVLAVLLGLVCEWRVFQVDESFPYFITHVTDLTPATLILIAIGALLGYWFGKGRTGGVWPRRASSKN